MPNPVRIYNGNVNDVEAFIEARDCSPRPAIVRACLDENVNPLIVQEIRVFVVYMYDAFRQTAQVNDFDTKDGQVRKQFVQWKEDVGVQTFCGKQRGR